MNFFVGLLLVFSAAEASALRQIEVERISKPGERMTRIELKGMECRRVRLILPQGVTSSARTPVLSSNGGECHLGEVRLPKKPRGRATQGIYFNLKPDTPENCLVEIPSSAGESYRLMFVCKTN